MRVVGFTFIRNALKFDYPIIEAIQSILPLCDEVLVMVGKSEDNTLELIQSLGSKIKIIESIWDDSLREGGAVLASETNKAIEHIPNDADWAIYIQGDEVIHEKYLPVLKAAMLEFKDSQNIDGLLLKYKHFYASYDYVGVSSQWYRKEIRIIKPNRGIYSYKDAQGFRKNNNQKLSVKEVDAYVYHYGWVKDPEAQQRKQQVFHTLWHDDSWVDKNVRKADAFDYSNIDALELFSETHPEVMHERLKRVNWKFDYDLTKNNLSLKEKFKNIIERLTGWRIGEYKNYKKV